MNKFFNFFTPSEKDKKLDALKNDFVKEIGKYIQLPPIIDCNVQTNKIELGMREKKGKKTIAIFNSHIAIYLNDRKNGIELNLATTGYFTNKDKGIVWRTIAVAEIIANWKAIEKLCLNAFKKRHILNSR